jgi:predicted kinase
MQTLFSKDMGSLDYPWMIERVNRCCEQIWHVSEQILTLDGHAVLDLGFTTRAQRKEFRERAVTLDITPEVHYLDAPKEIRKMRIKKRNSEKDPRVFAFEVTDMMFNFMEPRFEAPDQDELVNGLRVNTGSHGCPIAHEEER